MQYFKFT